MDGNKLFYSIGEVAEKFQVAHSLIRFWEKEFAEIKPKKNAKGNRQFTQKDIAYFEKIYHLVKVQGFTLEGARKALKAESAASIQEPSANTEKELKETLLHIKKKLLELKNSF